MALEIERRFLVNGTEWKTLATPQLLQQGYLKLNAENDIRVRIIDDEAWITIKKRRTDVSRWEFEYPIPVADAKAMLAQLCTQQLSKRRYRVCYHQQFFDIDEYMGNQSPLILAEIELTSENTLIEPPPWLGTEVTHDECFQLAYLSQHPYATWSDPA
ncbi:CYTH domain-containing protein [Snodgrassella sp. CFCC 13594]|uniref:CYTH domain-containing protein n=1 Tax=Snodgrassella sp. CFCC 13594 TaxID=1775559 RepID=UPI000830CC0D|nr:CYTH domain-containing protein [Snodgrassella sp. CFCC 13594]